MIRLLNVQMPGDPVADFRGVILEAGVGNDRVDILESATRFFIVNLGEGDDELKFNANLVEEEASLEGGPGFDRLSAHDNAGKLVWFGFEDENVS